MSNARQVNAMLLSAYMDGMTKQIIAIYNRFLRYEIHYGVDLRPYWGQAEKLILREIRYVSEPSQVEASALDEAWTQWSDRVLRCLEDAHLDLVWSDEKRRLRDYTDAVSVGRARVS